MRLEEAVEAVEMVLAEAMVWAETIEWTSLETSVESLQARLLRSRTGWPECRGCDCGHEATSEPRAQGSEPGGGAGNVRSGMALLALADAPAARDWGMMRRGTTLLAVVMALALGLGRERWGDEEGEVPRM